MMIDDIDDIVGREREREYLSAHLTQQKHESLFTSSSSYEEEDKEDEEEKSLRG